MWQAIRGLVCGGTTVLLTTQHLDEADQLADRICVIDAGRVIAEGTPRELKSQVGGDRIEVVVREQEGLAGAAAILSRIANAETSTDIDDRRASVPVHDRVGALTEALRAFEDAAIAIEDIAIRRPTLDDVFIHLTGHRAEQPASPATSHETMTTEAAA